MTFKSAVQWLGKKKLAKTADKDEEDGTFGNFFWCQMLLGQHKGGHISGGIFDFVLMYFQKN